MILSSQYLVQTVWFQLREWRKNGLEVLKLNISKGPVSRPPLSGSDCLNLVLDFGTTLPVSLEDWRALEIITSFYTVYLLCRRLFPHTRDPLAPSSVPGFSIPSAIPFPRFARCCTIHLSASLPIFACTWVSYLPDNLPILPDNLPILPGFLPILPWSCLDSKPSYNFLQD